MLCLLPASQKGIMPKQILYRNHCTPQEKISPDGRYYLDSDCGRKLTGSYLLELGSDTITTDTITSSGELGGDTGFDFISVRVVSGDDVTLSLDNGTTQIITISEGECFSSMVTSAAQPYVTISGTSTVEYITGT